MAQSQFEEINKILDNCKFCGGKAYYTVDVSYEIRCTNCGVLMSGNSKEDVINRWNLSK